MLQVLLLFPFFLRATPRPARRPQPIRGSSLIQPKKWPLLDVSILVATRRGRKQVTNAMQTHVAATLFFANMTRVLYLKNFFALRKRSPLGDPLIHRPLLHTMKKQFGDHFTTTSFVLLGLRSRRRGIQCWCLCGLDKIDAHR